MNRDTGEVNDGDLTAFFNRKNGGVAARRIGEQRQKDELKWLLHENADVDVALLPFPLTKEDDVKVIPDHLFLDSANLLPLYDVFFLSYQPNIRLATRVCPVVRSGTISLVCDDGTFYIDAAAFPGNSGSPVFLKPSPFRFEDGALRLGGDDELGGKFVGVIGEYVPYQEYALSQQTGRIRVMFEENTGLSRVWSSSLLKEIKASPAFDEQVQRLREMMALMAEQEDAPEKGTES